MQPSSKQLLSILAASVFVFAFASSVNAQGRGEANRAQNPTVTGQVRSCEARLDALTMRMSQLVRLSDNMQRVFDSISQRVQNYYSDSVLPTGATVPNYNELLADIVAKQSAVETAINEAQIDVDNFSCLSNPRALFNEFRTDMQTVKSTLGEYRHSIRNLIVAVRTIAPDDEEESAEVEENGEVDDSETETAETETENGEAE